MDRIERLEYHLNVTLGRVNGLNVLLGVIARELPAPVAQKCLNAALETGDG